MRFRFHPTTLAMALALVPLAAQPAPQTPAAPQAPMHGARKAWDRMAERLKLTEAQKTQLQAIRARHAEADKALKASAMEARKAFREAYIRQDTPADQLRTLHQAQEDKDFQLLLDHRTMQDEIHAILTPEQRIEWDKLQAYRMGMMMGRKEKRGF